MYYTYCIGWRARVKRCKLFGYVHIHKRSMAETANKKASFSHAETFLKYTFFLYSPLHMTCQYFYSRNDIFTNF